MLLKMPRKAKRRSRKLKNLTHLMGTRRVGLCELASRNLLAVTRMIALFFIRRLMMLLGL